MGRSFPCVLWPPSPSTSNFYMYFTRTMNKASTLNVCTLFTFTTTLQRVVERVHSDKSGSGDETSFQHTLRLLQRVVLELRVHFLVNTYFTFTTRRAASTCTLIVDKDTSRENMFFTFTTTSRAARSRLRLSLRRYIRRN